MYKLYEGVEDEIPPMDGRVTGTATIKITSMKVRNHHFDDVVLRHFHFHFRLPELDLLKFENCSEIKNISYRIGIPGTIPNWVNGSLFRNGPAMYRIGDDKFEHLFDGMAAISKFDIRNGTATYSRKFVKSTTFKKNLAANKIVVSEFGTMAKYPDPCKNIFQRFFSYFLPDEPTDNTCVTVWPLRDRMFASTETNIIHEIDTDNLDTVRRVDLKNCMTIDGATAHVHWERDGTIHNIGYSYSGDTSYCIFKVPGSSDDFRDGKVVASVKSRWRWNPGYYHSFAITENYYVFLEQPLVVNILKILTSKIRGAAFTECFDFWPNEKTIFHVISRATGEEINNPFVYQADAFFTFHHCNAYEAGDDLVMDLCAYDDDLVIKKLYMKDLSKENIEETYRTIPKAMLNRFVLPLVLNSETTMDTNLVGLTGCDATATRTTDTVIHCTAEILFDKGFELPTVNYDLYNGKKYRYIYGLSFQSKDFDTVVKVDVDTKTAVEWSSPWCGASEPIFVPRPDAIAEDDGVVLTAITSTIDGTHAFLLLLDGKTFTEIGRVEFPDVKFVKDIHGFFRKGDAK